MGKTISLAVNGSTTELFLSDFNSNSEEVYIPRIHVSGPNPRIFSLLLGLSSDRAAFGLISASEGQTSEFAQPDRETSDLRCRKLDYTGAGIACPKQAL